MSSENVSTNRFNLIDCIGWIEKIQSKYVCLYFLRQFYCLSSEIVTKLKQIKADVKFIVLISSSSGVETISSRVRDDKSTPDSVIYFGSSCLCPANYSCKLPTLFMSLEKDEGEIQFISQVLEKVDNSYQKILLISDLTNSAILQKEHLLSLHSHLKQNLVIAKFAKHKPASNWFFQDSILSLFDTTDDEDITYYPYIIPGNFDDYNLVVFIGDCKNLEFVINCKKLLIIHPQERSSRIVDGPSEFRKRVSLIEKFKNQVKTSFGIVFVNFNESVTPIMNQTRLLSKRIKKNPYYITLNQPDFELRLGNFGQLEGFVFVTSCVCNIDMSTFKFFYPVIFWKEFLIACGEKVLYGGIEWNENIDLELKYNQHDTDDIENENDREEKMKLIKRDLFKKPDSWFGLMVDPGSKQVSEIKEGQRGIPSSYYNEKELF